MVDERWGTIQTSSMLKAPTVPMSSYLSRRYRSQTQSYTDWANSAVKNGVAMAWWQSGPKLPNPGYLNSRAVTIPGLAAFLIIFKLKFVVLLGLCLLSQILTTAHWHISLIQTREISRTQNHPLPNIRIYDLGAKPEIAWRRKWSTSTL